MPDALKNIYSNHFIEQLSRHIQLVIESFDTRQFKKHIFSREWESMELKQRMRHIALTLQKQLAPSFPESLAQIVSIVKHLETNGVKGGFEYMFFPDFIEQFGLEFPDQSLKAFESITPFASCEFAIRPFIKLYTARSMKQMLKWSKHKNHHIRRLSSEGCRPRLPWAMAIEAFKKDPSPILQVLENLKNDPSEYVRRSVANNLNDIAKDHPAIVAGIVQQWKGLSKETDWIIRHGSRTLLKKADPAAYALFGLSGIHTAAIKNFLAKPKTIAIGETLHFSFDVILAGETSKLRIDFAVYYLKSAGRLARKIFRITENVF